MPGTVGAAYWIDRGLSVADAIARILKANPHGVETEEQEVALREFAQHRANSRAAG